ncbi:MAG: YgfZ/GcvT domain-containing protein, partial [Acidimicrobiia bacterium]
LLLQPQGKLDTDLWVWRTGPETFRLGCEVGRGAALAESLGRWKIRVKAEIADQTGRWGCLSLRGARGGEVASDAAGVDVPEPTHAHRLWPGRGEVRLVRADWPVPGGGGGTGGVDVVGPVGDLEGAWEALVAAGAVPAGLTAYEAARVRAGVPRQGPDLDERTIPQEAFLEVDAVSFTKGCFIGQELVCRIHDRGRVNRLLRRLRVAPGSPTAASDTTVAVGAAILWDGKEVGTVTTVARSEAGVVALGYLRREVEMPAEVTLRWDGGEAPAQVTDLSDLSEPA